jgi:hypothetical protein
LTRLSDLNDQRNDLYCNNCVTDIGRCTGCRERKAERLQQLQEQLQQSEQSVLDMQAEAAMAKEKLREMELARMSVIQVSHQGPSFAAAAVLFSLPLLLPPQLLLLLPLLLWPLLLLLPPPLLLLRLLPSTCLSVCLPACLQVSLHWFLSLASLIPRALQPRHDDANKAGARPGSPGAPSAGSGVKVVPPTTPKPKQPATPAAKPKKK